MKFLIWLVIGFAVVTWITRVKSRLSATERRSDAGADRAAEPMLQCARCGLYFPASEACYDASGAAFCSEAHRV